MAEPIPVPSLEIRCPACHTLLVQVEGEWARLLGGAVRVQCRVCGKKRWLRHDSFPEETAQDANSTNSRPL